MKKEQVKVRELALDLLLRIGEQGGYSHLMIDQKMKKHSLDKRDGALLTELVYGTLQRKLTLDYYLSPFVKQKKAVNSWVKWLLYLSIYQMHFLTKIPEHAIIHESVDIAKKRGHKGIANFVNGVLRSIQRKGLPSVDSLEDPVKAISIQTSHPDWLVKRWVDQYGLEITREMCELNLSHKQMSIRTQPLKISRKELLKQLENDGIEARPSTISDQGIVIEKGNVLKHPSFQQNLFTIQDESSMLVAEMMDVEKGMVILDACSAPGGKATHIAERTGDQGVIHAYDLHAKKAKLVDTKAKELELTSITTGQADARMLQQKHQPETFDRILVDAPCSGLGVLRSKPDIKYNKRESDIERLADIQTEILEHIIPLLKQNGKLVYSTCTVDKAENEEVIAHFLKKHSNYEVDPQFFEELPDVLKNERGISAYGIQIFPQDVNSDGFFMTRLKQK
ncbi:16S rRNA (cytosine(967)-C(5))-methyltransferase RsmB [Gracilibacillus sp. YIM 98692]|uniref:16S rRNA (cytosine(967)-C(5))-methyltransferase RsmB n=1 Tax=Gracilibacillus sp. YIM 98692 TaxID=2663532 RepID=UPI0013D5CBCA|nr:16S rRNA (cytosine(967)-C(5))-methyltransferase RsmB [Gracilibacillus sp. YIM 98692]